jgi:hypothetical protein
MASGMLGGALQCKPGSVEYRVTCLVPFPKFLSPRKHKEATVHAQEWRSIGPNEGHEHGNGGDLAEERDYVVLDHLEQVPYQRGTGKDACGYVPVLPQ